MEKKKEKTEVGTELFLQGKEKCKPRNANGDAVKKMSERKKEEEKQGGFSVTAHAKLSEIN